MYIVASGTYGFYKYAHGWLKDNKQDRCKQATFFSLCKPNEVLQNVNRGNIKFTNQPYLLAPGTHWTSEYAFAYILVMWQ